MYHSLFNDVTDAISKLQQAQQKTEEMYMDSKETILTLFLKKSEERKNDRKPAPAKKKPPSHDER
jgi:hypothetical protein